jgi:hypothetical protein
LSGRASRFDRCPCQSARAHADIRVLPAGGNMGMDSFASGGYPGIGMGRRERRKMDARDEQSK